MRTWSPPRLVSFAGRAVARFLKQVWEARIGMFCQSKPKVFIFFITYVCIGVLCPWGCILDDPCAPDPLLPVRAAGTESIGQELQEEEMFKKKIIKKKETFWHLPTKLFQRSLIASGLVSSALGPWKILEQEKSLWTGNLSWV